MVFQGGFMVFRGFWLVSMVFQGQKTRKLCLKYVRNKSAKINAKSSIVLSDYTIWYLYLALCMLFAITELPEIRNAHCHFCSLHVTWFPEIMLRFPREIRKEQ